MIREKKIKSGKLLEVCYYPVTQTGRAISRGSPEKVTSATQEKYNHKQRQKKIVRLVCANFDENDIFLTLTFKPKDAPADMAEAKKHLRNYLRRIKRYRENQSRNLKKFLKSDSKNEKLKAEFKKASQPMKYLYAIESKTYQRGQRKGEKSYHFHIFISGAGSGDRDAYENMWSGIAVAKRYAPEKYGIDAAARYITKMQLTAQREKCIGCSRNLKKPDEKIKDGKITEGGLARIAKSRMTDSEYWERKNRSYRFISGKASYNDINGQWYISVVMFKGDAPPIKIEEWEEDADGSAGAAEGFQLGAALGGTVP